MALRLSQLAGLWSKDPAFIQFLNHHHGDECSDRFGLGKSDIKPADHIRKICNVTSRRELDTNDQAADIFNRKIRTPFMNWGSTSGNGGNHD